MPPMDTGFAGGAGAGEPGGPPPKGKAQGRPSRKGAVGRYEWAALPSASAYSNTNGGQSEMWLKIEFYSRPDLAASKTKGHFRVTQR